MNILIIGSGAREHALAWKCAQNNTIQRIFIAPGNALCTNISKVSLVQLVEIDDLLGFALSESIALTLVGSEALLVAGIVDKFTEYHLPIFGPSAAAAQLEGSKAFAKNFMKKYNIQTADYQVFDDYNSAKAYLSTKTFPVVIKASGLAAGKGVIIANNFAEGIDALGAMLLHDLFAEAGHKVIIEDYIHGREVSLMAITDGKTILPLLSVLDHKKIGHNDTGKNTGGMGAIAPNPYFSEAIQQLFMQTILEPTLSGIIAEQLQFTGVIFFGLILNKNGVYLLEYNMRFGDPETQTLLPLLTTDLIDIIQAAICGKLADIHVSWLPAVSCCVVAASAGYPDNYQINHQITGLDEFFARTCNYQTEYLFGAGIKLAEQTVAEQKSHHNLAYVTSSGRVLSLVAIAPTQEDARINAYQAIKAISFQGIYMRDDIGIRLE